MIDGDASNVPQGPVVGVDGGYLGGVYDGRTWRSSEGLEWELVDLGGDGVDDESVFGEFEFRGETWARTSDDAGARSNDGLARWDGDTFVPVALPESPFEGLDGLRISDRFVGAPVVVGDELVVSVTTLLEVPWGELFAGDDVHAEWPGAPEPIRIVDWSSGQDLAVLSAEFIDGEPGRFEFRDKVTPRLPLAVGGEIIAEPGGIGEILRVLRDGADGVCYHVRFPGRTLQVPEAALDACAGRDAGAA